MIDAAIKKIDRYLLSNSNRVLVVDLQYKDDIDAIVEHYSLPLNVFVAASDDAFCNYDELPKLDALFNFLSCDNRNIFVRGLSSYCFLQGEKAMTQTLNELLHLSISGHVIIMTFRCTNFVKKLVQTETRLKDFVFAPDDNSDETPRPELIFIPPNSSLKSAVIGINNIMQAVEDETRDVVYVKTNKSKDIYPYSCYTIHEMKDPYDALCQIDFTTKHLSRVLGSDENWQYALDSMATYNSWQELISMRYGDFRRLDLSINNYKNNKSDNQWLWLLFVGLKLFGSGTSKYLKVVVENSRSYLEFAPNVYLFILNYSHTDPEFLEAYKERKRILLALENPTVQLSEFCKLVRSKNKNAIYYLTDNTVLEQELIFELLSKFEYSQEELSAILMVVYPALYEYLEPYSFGNDLLDRYFEEYKYQKLTNKIMPDFMSEVEKQATDRDYLSILSPRSSVIENINYEDAQTYFVDAMGVEYLSFILAECRKLSLIADITVCRCELPSITSYNKDFYDVLSSTEYPVITVSELDEIKHHGKYGYNYDKKSKLPIHLSKELEIIAELLRKIQVQLMSEKYSKAILISDHGTSRLAVIHEHEVDTLHEMTESGSHSGRCCLKNETDIKPLCAIDAGDYWALANYDRFKGGRKANVEVHGGATLEEVTIPIIEISYFSNDVKIIIMPGDESNISDGIPEVTVERGKPSSIKLYISQKMKNVNVKIDGHLYSATAIDNNYYVVDNISTVKCSKVYYVDVYTNGNKIAEDLPLRIKKKGFSENNIL
ncbi:MAG: BREX-4 system phosphatase PglZ [Oscillospiraceae bacterium]|nr:BREX-4 system phosphatase PglZ [Oscillospiraceae bacterium]